MGEEVEAFKEQLGFVETSLESQITKMELSAQERQRARVWVKARLESLARAAGGAGSKLRACVPCGL